MYWTFRYSRHQICPICGEEMTSEQRDKSDNFVMVCNCGYQEKTRAIFHKEVKNEHIHQTTNSG